MIIQFRSASLLLLLFTTVVATWSQPHCGQRHARVKRIYGGKEAAVGAWPWMAHLRWKSNATFVFKCSGTIVGRRWILTAAHCVKNPYTYVATAYVGIHDIDRDFEDFNNQSGSNVAEIHVHPHYDHAFINGEKGKKVNDIALIKLRKPLEFSDRIQPICLASHENEITQKGAKMFVAGWGVIAGGSSTGYFPRWAYTDELRQAEITIYKMTDNPFAVAQSGPFANQFLYALATAPSGACHGDSGSPIMKQSEASGYWFDYGIMIRSHVRTPYACKDQFWGIDFYTRMSTFCRYIEETTEGEVNCMDPNK